jgi:alanine dehydrogenase
LVEWLLDGGHVGLSLEYYERGGIRPISGITGRITGEMVFLYGAFYAQAQLGGSGRLLVGDRSDPGRVVVIGHGNVGGAAVRAAVRNGCTVTVAGRSVARAESFRTSSGLPIRAVASGDATFDAAVANADLVIGAILISTFDTPPIVSERMVAGMRPGAVIVDATAGYSAGYLATMPPDITDPPPVTTAHGVVHIKIDLYPALVPATTVREVSHEFRAAVAEYLDKGVSGALRSALVVTDGRIVNDEVQRHWHHWRRP